MGSPTWRRPQRPPGRRLRGTDGDDVILGRRTRHHLALGVDDVIDGGAATT